MVDVVPIKQEDWSMVKASAEFTTKRECRYDLWTTFQDYVAYPADVVVDIVPIKQEDWSSVKVNNENNTKSEVFLK